MLFILCSTLGQQGVLQDPNHPLFTHLLLESRKFLIMLRRVLLKIFFYIRNDDWIFNMLKESWSENCALERSREVTKKSERMKCISLDWKNGNGKKCVKFHTQTHKAWVVLGYTIWGSLKIFISVQCIYWVCVCVCVCVSYSDRMVSLAREKHSLRLHLPSSHTHRNRLT